MSEYIDREEAIDALKKDVMGGLNYGSILKSLPAADVQPEKWIPVTERLPQGGDESGELCENVILLLSVCFNKNYVTSGWINGVTKKAYYLDEKDDFLHKTDISNVKAWMPLPEPPKDGET